MTKVTKTSLVELKLYTTNKKMVLSYLNLCHIPETNKEILAIFHSTLQLIPHLHLSIVENENYWYNHNTISGIFDTGSSLNLGDLYWNCSVEQISPQLVVKFVIIKYLPCINPFNILGVGANKYYNMETGWVNATALIL